MQTLVGILMGSQSDWLVMENCALTLEKLGIAYEAKVLSAHRAPDAVFEYAQTAEDRGLEVIIAGAGCAAHLPGVIAAKTSLPVLGVPLQAAVLDGLDALLAIVQMPGGIPVGTLAIGKAGAKNAALLATAILANKYPEIKTALKKFRAEQTKKVLENTEPKK